MDQTLCKVLAVSALICCAAQIPQRGAALAQEADADNAATQEYVVILALQNKGLATQAAARWKKFIETYTTDERLDKAHYHLGTCQLQAQQFAEAQATFRDVLTKFPNFASRDAVQFNLALAQFKAAAKPEELTAAAAAFAEVPAKYGESKLCPRAIYYQAECLYNAGDAKAALPIYQQFAQKFTEDPLLPQVLYALGTAQQEAGQLAEGAATFAAFVAKFDKHELADECRLRQGLCLFQQNKPAEAEPLFAPLAAKAEFALADLALLRQAQCQQAQGKTAEAIGLCQSLLTRFAMSKYRAAAQLEIGKYLFQTENFAEALAPLQEAIAAKTDESPLASYWLAKSLIKLSRAAEALPPLDQALAAYANTTHVPLLTVTRIDALYEQPEQRKQTPALYAQFAAAQPDHELAPHCQYMAAYAALACEDAAAARQHAAAFLSNAKFAQHALTPDVLGVAAEAQLRVDPPQPAEAEKLFKQLVEKFAEHPQAPAARVRIGHCQVLQQQSDAAVQGLSQSLPHLKDAAHVAEAQLLIGRGQAELKKLPEAAAAFTASLAAKPDWDRGDEVLLRLAYALRDQQKPAEAAPHLNRLLTQFTSSTLRPAALFELGQLAEAEQKWDEAAARYREVLAQFPESESAALAAFGIGHALFAKQDYSNAADAYGQLLAKYPQHPLSARGRFDRALAYYRLKQFQPAIADLTAYLESKPAETDALEARYALALCHVGLTQHDQAAQVLQAMLSEKPDYAQADKVYYELAFALKAQQKDKEAADAFLALATKLPASPRAPEAYYRVGRYHREGERFDEAVQAIAAGLKLPADAQWEEELRYELGFTHYRGGKFAEAAAAFAEQLQKFPQGKHAAAGTFLSAECLFKQDKFQESLPLFEKSVALAAAEKNEDYHARSLYRAGAAAAGLQLWPASETHYAALLAAYPKFERGDDARYGLGRAMQMQNKLPPARAAFEEVIEATRGQNTELRAKALFMAGECDFAEKKYEAAVERFIAASVYPFPVWQAKAHLETARCLIELKKLDEARASLTTVVEKFAESPEAAAAKTLLEALKKS